MHHDNKITFTPSLPYFHHQTQPITHQRGILRHIQIPPNLWHPHVRFFKGCWAIFYIKRSRFLVPIWCWWNLIITHIIEKTYFVSIGLPTIPMICLRFHHYWKTLLQSKISFVFHHSNGFLEFFNYTTKLQKQHSPTFSKHNAHTNPLWTYLKSKLLNYF
jgi:hypothetical protein